MSKLKKILLIIFASIMLLIVLVIIFISPIAKYLIQKYDQKFTGRQITLDWAYVNPFTGYVHLNDVKIYEFKSDSVFFSANGISANLEMYKLLSKTYEITELTLNHPKGIVFQNKKDFNFNDLIKKFSEKDTIASKPKKAPLKFSLMNIKLIDGEFFYHEKQTPVNYSIKNVNIESTGLRWDADTIATKFTLVSGIGIGNIKGNITINTKTSDYKLATQVNKFSLDIIEQYLKDIINYGSLRAFLDADIKSIGNFKDQEKVTTSGSIIVSDFHFGKNPKEDYAAFDKLVLAIGELSPKKHIYYFDSISLMHPYFKYERYDYLDNVQTIFGKKGSNIKAANNSDKFNLIIEIANYIQVISKNFLNSHYKIDRLAIYKADLRFNDFSTTEQFSAALNPFYFTADLIDKNNKRVDFFLKSGIKPYGNLTSSISINPKDSTDFDITCRLQKIPLAMFNPYVISFTSFPLDRGTLSFNANWNVDNGIIQSKNHLLIVDPRTTKKLKNKDTKWIPVPLIMAFIKERGNVIDYEIPITGDLKNPKFHFKDVILDLIDNIFVKPPTTPYRLEVKSTETEIEKSLAIKWNTRNYVLESKQEKFIDKIAYFLEDNPKAFISVYPQHFTQKEKEYILFYEAKKKYYLIANHKNYKSFNEDDSEAVVKMSIKDSLFVHFLDTNLKGIPNIFTIQGKCSYIIDSNIVNNAYAQLNLERKLAFISFFKEKKVENRVKFAPAVDVVPYNGFSFYKIKYQREIPPDLLEAYQKLNEYNDETPRSKFKKEHNNSIKKL